MAGNEADTYNVLDGVINIGANGIALVTDGSFSISNAMADVTAAGDTWSSSLDGIKGLTGSVSYYRHNSTSAAQDAIETAMVAASTSVTMELLFKDEAGKKKVSFTAKLPSLDFSFVANAAAGATGTLNFQSTGAVTIGTVSA